MGQIIQLPSPEDRIRADVDDQIFRLGRMGIGTEGQRQIAAEMKRRLAGIPLTSVLMLPQSIDSETAIFVKQQTEAWIRAIVVPLVGEMLIAVVELHLAGALAHAGAPAGA